MIAEHPSLRLMIITASFQPTTGGAETYAFEIARSLAVAGHTIAVVTDLPFGLRSDHNFVGDPPEVKVHRLSNYLPLLNDESKIRWEQMMFGLLPELNDLVNRFEPNLVLSNSLDTAVLAKVVQLERRIPWAAAFHEQTPETEAFGGGRLRFVYEVLHPDLVIAGSDFYAARARRWGADDRVTTIHHGIDTEQFHPLIDGKSVRNQYGIQPDELLIVCSGRLKQRKGIKELIGAFARLVLRRPNTRLLIVGSVNSASRQYADDLRAEVARLDIASKVIFDEAVIFAAMPSVLGAADIVAQPSFAEGLGLSVLEAMASGKPVVTTEIPGIREIITEPDVAITVPPGDIAALVDALDSLMDSAALRDHLACRGRQHVERKFSRSRMIQQTEAALLGLLRGAMEGVQ